MTLRSAWHSFWKGEWTANRLMSRKWWALIITASIVVVVSYTFVAMLGIYSSTIVEKGLDVLKEVVIAYFSVNLLQKVVEAYKEKNGSGEV
jgi:hypothetical protein